MNTRQMRACMVCSILQTHKQFLNTGCPNCEDVLGLRNSPDMIAECTSQVFDGTITLADPATSWVAKWLRLSDYVPAMYAVKVTGTLSQDMIEQLQDNGIRYVPRDGGELEEDVE